MQVFSILRNKSFRRLWVASRLSMVGSQISRFGLILYLYHDTNSITALAYLLALETLPCLIIAPFAGALIDHCDKRKVMIASDLARMLFILVIVFHPTSWVIYCMVGLHSVGTTLFEPAKSASMPMIVDADELPKANGMEQSAANVVLIVGPVIGAELYTQLGLTATLVIDALSFAASALLIMNVKIREANSEDDGVSKFALTEITHGWRYLLRHAVARHLIGLSFVSLLCVGLWLPLVPSFIHNFLGGSDRILGLQMSVFGIGGILGGLWAPRLGQLLGKGTILFWALLTEGFTMMLYSFVPHILTSVFICFLWGVCISIILVPYYSIIQETVHEKFLGRILTVAKQIESFAILLAILLAISIYGPVSADRIFFIFGFLYIVFIAVSASTRGGRMLLKIR